MSRLTSVARVKRYLAVTTAGQDALIDRLIPTESAVVERYVSREFGFVATAARRLNGTGTGTIVLPEQPVIAVTSLTVCGASVPLSDDGMKAGFVFDDISISLIGAKFPSGRQNVAAAWSSGYQATENDTIPTGNAPTIEPVDFGFALTANAVNYANGTALAAATSNAPLVGQFFLADGVFTFNTGDGGQAVTLVYGYVPADIEQAAIEMVGLDLKQRDNLGVASKSLAGESITYEKASMSKSVKDMLQSYRRVAPV